MHKILSLRRRAHNIGMVILSYIFFLYRGTGKGGAHSQKFVVLYPTGNIGDMVCITPLFKIIKKHNSDATITVIGASKNRELLRYHKDIDEYIDIPGSMWKLIRIVQSRKFDAGIIINLDVVNLATLYMGCVKGISCLRLTREYAHMETVPYRLLTPLVHNIEYFPGQYVPEQYLKLLNPFGIDDTQSQKTLFHSPESALKITEELELFGIQRDEKIIVIAPGAGSDIKRWPTDRFAEVAQYLSNTHNIPLVIIGGANDQHSVQDMIQSLDAKVRYWSPGPQSFDELKAVLARAHLVIGNDSGAIHVGEAVGSLTLTIAGVTDVGEHIREDVRHRIVKADSAHDLYRSYIGDESEMDTDIAREHMESVSVETVIQMTDDLIKIA